MHPLAGCCCWDLAKKPLLALLLLATGDPSSTGQNMAVFTTHNNTTSCSVSGVHGTILFLANTQNQPEVALFLWMWEERVCTTVGGSKVVEIKEIVNANTPQYHAAITLSTAWLQILVLFVVVVCMLLQTLLTRCTRVKKKKRKAFY